MINARRTPRRLTLTIVALFAIVLLFSGRLFDIQVVRAATLNSESLGKRSVAVKTYGARGAITDSNGVPLASSVDRFDITASPRNVADLDRKNDKRTVREMIAQLADVTGEDVATITASLAKNPTSDFAFVSKLATLEVRGKVRALKIPWVYDQVHPSRTYPSGAVAGNLVGFIGTDGPQAGLEFSYESCLAPTSGSSTYEKSKDGVRLPGSTVTEKEPVDGGTLKLTIDADFQWYVQEQLAAQAQVVGADWGTATVVRVSDGHIMALADYPSVDPNNVSGVPNTALGSLAFSTPYEPGSTFKPMTVAMLIDQGKVEIGTQMVVPGRIYFDDGHYIKDVWSHGDLHMTVAGVLMNSSNTGISLLSDNLTKDQRYDYLKKFGIGTRTGAFPGESAGLLPKTSAWERVRNYNIAFGQGVSTTSAQIASVYQTLGNNGVRMPLTLVEGCTLPDGTVTDLPDTKGIQVVSEYAADQTVLALETIATKSALTNLISIPGYRIAAKSGTAEVAAGGIYTNDRIVSLAGLVPADNPEYAVVVTLGKPDILRSSVATAPAFKNIMTQIIKTFRVEPSPTASPDIPVTW